MCELTLFDTRVQLGDFDGKPVYPGLKYVRPLRQISGLPGELTEHVLRMFRQRRQLSET